MSLTGVKYAHWGTLGDMMGKIGQSQMAIERISRTFLWDISPHPLCLTAACTLWMPSRTDHPVQGRVGFHTLQSTPQGWQLLLPMYKAGSRRQVGGRELRD